MNRGARFTALPLGWGILAVLMLAASCRRHLDSSPQWDTEWLMPLLKADLSINDLLADSLVQVEDDQSLTLVLTADLYRAGVQDLTLQIPDTAIATVFSLQTIKLADQSLVYPLTLGALCAQLGLLGQILLAYHGQHFTVPPLADLTTPDNPVDATAFFEQAQIESGELEVTLLNGFPLEWTNIVFEIRNQNDQQIIMRDTFSNLLPGTQQTRQINLAGKQVEGQLVARITDMDSPGGYVLIDTTDAMVITLKAKDIKVSEATAVFPAQNLVDEDQLTTYSLSGGAELSRLGIRGGTLGLRVISSVAQECYLEYALPSALNASGSSIFISKKLAAAPPGGTSEFYQSFDLTGYSFDLTGPQGNLFNTFFSHLILRMDSTGELVTLSGNDSIRLVYELTDIEAEYLEGYFGQQIVGVDAEAGLALLPGLSEGTLTLSGARLALEIENAIGVSGRINLYELLAANTMRGSSLPLSWTQLGKPIAVAAATGPPLTPTTTTLWLDEQNSNVSALLSLLPDRLAYRMDVFINPEGNSSGHNDFAYADSYLQARLACNIPLSLAASDLLLSDTLNFSLSSAETPQQGPVREGLFEFHAVNGFPLQAAVQVYFYDDNFYLLDSLFSAPQMVAAAKPGADCRVDEPETSLLRAYFSEGRMDRLRLARKAVVRVRLGTATSAACPTVRIYDDYRLQLQLTGRFTYRVGS